MLLPLISIDIDKVSIGKLSLFIDFYNYYPVLVHKIRHKNDTSKDLYLYTAKQHEKQNITEEQ